MNLPQDTCMHKCKNKINLISYDSRYILFNYNERWIFTLDYLRTSTAMLPYPQVFVDEGARQPILRGSDIFVPGVYKYRNMLVKDFAKNDIVVVNIIGYGIFAIAVSLIDSGSMNGESKGVGFKILSVENDELDRMKRRK